MLMNRIIGAFTFRKGVYAEVEADTSFTTTAWILVAVVAFLNQLGSMANSNLLNWLLGAILGTIFAVIGFAVGAFVINWMGRTLFSADVSFDEMVRTLGLAYVWQAIGVFGILGAFSTALGCITAPVVILGVLLMIAAWFIAAKEALDLEWGQTIVTVIMGWLALVVVLIISGLVLGALGLGTALMVGSVTG